MHPLTFSLSTLHTSYITSFKPFSLPTLHHPFYMASLRSLNIPTFHYSNLSAFLDSIFQAFHGISNSFSHPTLHPMKIFSLRTLCHLSISALLHHITHFFSHPILNHLCYSAYLHCITDLSALLHCITQVFQHTPTIQMHFLFFPKAKILVKKKILNPG